MLVSFSYHLVPFAYYPDSNRTHSGRILRTQRLRTKSLQTVPFAKTPHECRPSAVCSALNAQAPGGILLQPVWMDQLLGSCSFLLHLPHHILVSMQPLVYVLAVAFEIPVTFVATSLRWRNERCIQCSTIPYKGFP